MAPRPVSDKDRSKKNLKSKRQQRSRRRQCLFKKAKEYCTKCDADVFLILRIRKNGQIFFLNSDATGQWPPTPEQLVSLGDIMTYSPLLNRLRTISILNQSKNLLRTWLMMGKGTTHSFSQFHPEQYCRCDLLKIESSW